MAPLKLQLPVKLPSLILLVPRSSVPPFNEAMPSVIVVPVKVVAVNADILVRVPLLKDQFPENTPSSIELVPRSMFPVIWILPSPEILPPDIPILPTEVQFPPVNEAVPSVRVVAVNEFIPDKDPLLNAQDPVKLPSYMVFVPISNIPEIVTLPTLLILVPSKNERDSSNLSKVILLLTPASSNNNSFA